MKSTHKSVSHIKTNRGRERAVLKALKDLEGEAAANDTMTLQDLAKYMSDYCYKKYGKITPKAYTISAFILKFGEIQINDGWHVIEIDTDMLYVDFTAQAIKEQNLVQKGRTYYDATLQITEAKTLKKIGL